MSTNDYDTAGIKFLKSALWELGLPNDIPDEELKSVLDILLEQIGHFVVDHEILDYTTQIYSLKANERSKNSSRRHRDAVERRRLERLQAKHEGADTWDL